MAPRPTLSLLLLALVAVACMRPVAAQEESAPEESLGVLTRLSDLVDPSRVDAILPPSGGMEVCTYRAERVLAGLTRAHALRVLTLPEDVNKQYWTRADWPHGQKPVVAAVRQTRTATVETPDGPFHFHSSLHAERANPARGLKAAYSVQEDRGSVFKEVRLYEDTVGFAWNSFWDGEGRGAVALVDWGENSYLEEELHLLVRLLRYRDGLQCRLMLATPQSTNNAAVPRQSEALLTIVLEPERVEVPAGVFDPWELWTVVVEARDGRVLRWRVAGRAPFRVVEFEADDGRLEQLASTETRRP